MLIEKVNFNHFRNLTQVSFSAASGFNLFYGDNAAGKTSILEALYYLGHARSFRTHVVSKLIQYDMSDRFVLFAELMNQDSLSSTVGIERGADGTRKIRINHQEESGLEQLAELLPMRLLHADCYRYFHDGSKSRRQLLDWGVFHVEPLFFRYWNESQRLLKQRNAALKQKLSFRQVSIWDKELIPLAESMDQFRKTYLQRFEPVFMEVCQRLLGEAAISLHYFRGWRKDYSFEQMLQQQFERDLQLGYTQSNPHRADMKVQYNNIDIQDSFSQGQQKLAAYALLLAQGLLLQKQTKISPIYLIDDLPSELDSNKQELVFDLLKQLDAQVFLTGIDKNNLLALCKNINVQLFHVEQGRVSRVASASPHKSQSIYC